MKRSPPSRVSRAIAQYGIDVTTALVGAVSDEGGDMSKFPSDKHFASWLGLGPGTKTTCGKVMSGKTNAVTVAVRKLARLIYAMLTQGQEYIDRGRDSYEERYRQWVLYHLAHKPKAMACTRALR